MRVLNRIAVVAAMLAAAAGCSSSQGSPSAPSPSVAQLAGTWTLEETLLGFDGGDCIGEEVRAGLPLGSVNTSTLVITQTGITVAAHTDPNPFACTYTGTVGPTSALMTVKCDGQGVASCSNGQSRQLALSSGRLDARLEGGVLIGTQTEMWAVTSYPAGQSFPTMVVSTSFRATR